MKNIDEIQEAISVCNSVIDKQNEIIFNETSKMQEILAAIEIRTRFLSRLRILEWIITEDEAYHWI